MKRILAVAAALALAVSSFAQSSMKVQAPNLVAADEQFNVSFVISGENAPSAFEWQPGDDFQLVWGPQKGTSTSVSIINGQHTRSSQTTYTYVLMPRKTGKFTLSPASATIKGERLSSPSFTIEVVSGGQGAQSGQNSQSGQGSQAQQSQQSSRQTGTVDSGDIFLRMNVSKGKAVVGETLTATLKLYQRVNIAGFDDVKFPTFAGFWSNELQAPSNIEFHRENVGDAIYNSAILRSWTLIPQQAGDLKIDPAELVCLVNVRAPRSSGGSIFDSFFQDEYQTIRKRVSTPAVTVHVSKLPAGAPASFTGGVGAFKMSASVSRDSLKAHDAASLKMVVTGKGNISLLEAPKINFPPDFETYDVKTTEGNGTRTFEYPFIPRSHGDFVLGPVEFTYYDVNAGKYVTLTSPEMPVSVARGAGNPSAPSDASGQLVAVPSNRKDVRDLGSDIRYIATEDPALSPKDSFFAGSALFWLIAALLVAAAAAVYFGLRGMAARRADVVGTRRRSATKMARRRLSQAGQYLSKDLYGAFYEELHKALLGFVSDKLSLDASEMSKDNIAGRLSERGVSEGLVGDFVALLDACEFARYSPSSGHEAMNAHYESAVAAISAIDDSMSRKHKAAPVAATLAALLATGLTLQAAQPADSLWTAGVQAYSDGQWEQAASNWENILGLGLESSDLYYNIGNARYKQGELAPAILSYERALKLDPSNSRARFNLDFANAQVQDKIETVPEFFLRTWDRNLCWLLPSTLWAIFCLILLAGALAMVLLFLLSSRGGLRKLGFFAAIVLLLLSLSSGRFAFRQRADCFSQDSAIVMKAFCPAKSSPGNGSGVDLFVLHEGTRIKVLDRVGQWCNVELADGRQGWVFDSDIEII